MIADRADNVYFPSEFRGDLWLGGPYLGYAYMQGIVVRVDPTGEAEVIQSKGLSPVAGDILQIALTGPREDGLIAIIDGRADGMEWSKHVPMTERAGLKMPIDDRRNVLVGDDAFAFLRYGPISQKYSLSLTRLGATVWTTPADEKLATIPQDATHVAHDGGRRIAVAGGRKNAGVVVFDIDGSLLWQAPFANSLHDVMELRFDSEGALWVFGHMIRYMKLDEHTMTAVEKPPPPGLMTRTVVDGWAERFDVRGKRTFHKSFPGEHYVTFEGFDAYAGVGYAIAFTWGSMEPYYTRPPAEVAKPIAILMGMDADGHVHTVMPLAQRASGRHQVVATKDGITVGIGTKTWNEAAQESEKECELVHFAVR